MKPLVIPPAVRPFTRGPWPAIGLLLACFLVLWVSALPQFAAAIEMREETAPQRGLVERQAALAAQAPTEDSRNLALTNWWRDRRELRVGGRTLDAASAALLDTLRARCEESGVRVASIERSVRSELLPVSPAAELVVVNLKLQADRMEDLASALATLESGAAPWLRLGNVTFTRQAYRALPGVQAEMTVYACLEAAGG